MTGTSREYPKIIQFTPSAMAMPGAPPAVAAAPRRRLRPTPPGQRRRTTAPPKNPTFDAIPDPPDFRDLLFVPTLVEVPTAIDLAIYRAARVPVLNQGNEGACTGFGLATVVHCLLRQRKVVPERDAVSPRMLYEMARRYDEWPGALNSMRA